MIVTHELSKLIVKIKKLLAPTLKELGSLRINLTVFLIQNRQKKRIWDLRQPKTLNIPKIWPIPSNKSNIGQVIKVMKTPYVSLNIKQNSFF